MSSRGELLMARTYLANVDSDRKPIADVQFLRVNRGLGRETRALEDREVKSQPCNLHKLD